MPELPEVETVRQTLQPLLSNHKIVAVKIFMNKIIKEHTTSEFTKIIAGQTINDIKRSGKLLIFVLDDYVLLSHLRMEGKYYYQQKDLPINDKHILLTLELDNNYNLYYHDTRRFGTFHLQPLYEYQNLKPFTKIGPEPFDKKVTASYLKSKWQHKKQPIKTSLLEQGVMSGLGNIYVNEVLFYAKIHPESSTKNLSNTQLQTIIDKSIMVLDKAITMRGSTIATYTSSLGVNGHYQHELQVHMRLNLPCYQCHNLIKKIKVNGRGTYFCSYCQVKY